MTKWLGFLIGVLFSFLYAKLGLKGKTGAMVGAFVGCVVIEVALMFGVAALLVSTGYYGY